MHAFTVLRTVRSENSDRPFAGGSVVPQISKNMAGYRLSAKLYVVALVLQQT